MANPLLTFSSLRPKFSPLVSTTRSTCPTQPLPRDPPLCLFPCERVVPLHRVQETCFPCIQTDLGESGGRRSACGEISLRSCSRQTQGTRRPHSPAPVRTGPPVRCRPVYPGPSGGHHLSTDVCPVPNIRPLDDSSVR